MSKTTAFDALNEPLPQRIVVGLNKVGLALKLSSWRAAGQRGLTPLQGQILAMLSGARAGLRPTALAERLAVTAPTISQSVAALSSKGLVERRGDSDDGRVSLVCLTARGRTEARAASGWPDFLASAVEQLSEPEQEVFWKGLMKMVVTLQQNEQLPTSEMCLTCRHFRPHLHREASLPHHCALVDAPMGHRHLRLECAEHEASESEARDAVVRTFLTH